VIQLFSGDINFCQKTSGFSESATLSQNQIGSPSVGYISWLACGRRPIIAVATADLFCICEKISGSCGLEPQIASFRFNGIQTLYAHDLVWREVFRHALVWHELVSIIITSHDNKSIYCHVSVFIKVHLSCLYKVHI